MTISPRRSIAEAEEHARAGAGPASALRVVEPAGVPSTVLRRVIDVTFALVALTLTAPLLAVSIVLIRLDSPGPAIFRQPRMGKGGRIFYLVKLRGMYVDANDRFPELYDYAAAREEDSTGYYFHRTEDPRVTRVGRVLRKYSIDELPNFWNVLRGDMAIVGPRPEIPELAQMYGTDLQRFLSVRPGVTSPAKARGRDGLSLRRTIQSDLEYIDNRSLRLDVVTVFQTFWNAVRGHGVC
jgi:lipopolysaccharide/colanic/teichoic acid biosynthesis glycosyltransferase